MPVPEQKIEQYIKVRNLARGTSGPEQASALGILEKLRETHPGIEEAADAKLRAQEAPPKLGGLDWAESFLRGLNWAVETATGLYVGRELAKKVHFSFRQQRDGMHFKAVFSPAILNQLEKMSPAQRDVFFKTLVEDITEYLEPRV